MQSKGNQASSVQVSPLQEINILRFKNLVPRTHLRVDRIERQMLVVKARLDKILKVNHRGLPLSALVLSATNRLQHCSIVGGKIGERGK